jgi:prepilin signal peptidase PulO-like enzyme (type II secretory pathway)
MLLEVIQTIIAGAFGAIFGSYATLFAHRLPIGQSCFGRYFGPKSHCPNCKKILKTRELIPLVNWVVTKGKCCDCGFKIPRSHLFLELSIAILFMVNFSMFGFSDQFIIFSLILTAAMVGLVTDFKNNLLPDSILFSILLVGLANRVIIDEGIIDAIFSSAIGIIFAAIFYKIFFDDGKRSLITDKNQALAYAKFIALCSVCLNVPSFILYTACTLLILSIFLLSGKFSKKKSPRLGVALIVPFVWLLIYSPLN